MIDQLIHRETCMSMVVMFKLGNVTNWWLSSTSGENIGDTGLIQAYRAWKAQYEDSYDAGAEYLLPGLGYTRFAILDL